MWAQEDPRHYTTLPHPSLWEQRKAFLYSATNTEVRKQTQHGHVLSSTIHWDDSYALRIVGSALDKRGTHKWTATSKPVSFSWERQRSPILKPYPDVLAAWLNIGKKHKGNPVPKEEEAITHSPNKVVRSKAGLNLAPDSITQNHSPKVSCGSGIVRFPMTYSKGTEAWAWPKSQTVAMAKRGKSTEWSRMDYLGRLQNGLCENDW